MRNLFPHYYKPTDEQFQEIWKECVFCFDTNVLLDVYRYTLPTRDVFLEILKLLADRLWIPYQVAQEYQKNRLRVIIDQKQPYEQIKNLSDKSLKTLQSELEKLNLKGKKPHPFIDIDAIVKIIQDTSDNINKALEGMEAAHPDYMKEDSLHDAITNLFEGKVGNPYTQEELDKKYQEIKIRYQCKVPPGYQDNKDKKEPQEGDENPQSFGDAILWFQLLEFAQSTRKPIIFVTADVKEDWWLRIKGKTIGPRPELTKEMRDIADVTFYMYQPDQFMIYAQKYLDQITEGQEEAIHEIRALGQGNYYLEQIKSRWRDILKVAEIQNKNLLPLLNMAKPLYFDGHNLMLGFDYPVFKEKFDRVSNIQAIMSLAIAKATGFPSVNVEAVVETSWNVPSVEESTIYMPDSSNNYNEIDDIPF